MSEYINLISDSENEESISPSSPYRQRGRRRIIREPTPFYHEEGIHNSTIRRIMMDFMMICIRLNTLVHAYERFGNDFFFLKYEIIFETLIFLLFINDHIGQRMDDMDLNGDDFFFLLGFRNIYRDIISIYRECRDRQMFLNM